MDRYDAIRSAVEAYEVTGLRGERVGFMERHLAAAGQRPLSRDEREDWQGASDRVALIGEAIESWKREGHLVASLPAWVDCGLQRRDREGLSAMERCDVNKVPEPEPSRLDRKTIF